MALLLKHCRYCVCVFKFPSKLSEHQWNGHRWWCDDRKTLPSSQHYFNKFSMPVGAIYLICVCLTNKCIASSFNFSLSHIFPHCMEPFNILYYPLWLYCTCFLKWFIHSFVQTQKCIGTLLWEERRCLQTWRKKYLPSRSWLFKKQLILPNFGCLLFFSPSFVPSHSLLSSPFISSRISFFFLFLPVIWIA